MKKKTFLSLFVLFVCVGAIAQNKSVVLPHYFMENKGQIKDTKGNVRKDIDYALRSNNMLLLIGSGRIEYQYDGAKEPVIMQLVGNNSPKPIAEGGKDYTENYYQDKSIIEGVAAAERICYRNIYKGIDWIIYTQNGKIEHEFVISPNADAQQIKWQYKGCSQSITNGNIVLRHAKGTITEKTPQSFDQNGAAIATNYHKQNTLWAYTATAKQKIAYTIDPGIEWATYINGSDGEVQGLTMCNDKKGFLYIGGSAYASMGLASASGVYQSNKNLRRDAFVSKIDTNGNHIWTTYYGGNGGDFFSNVKASNSALYASGATGSTTDISSGGTEQDTVLNSNPLSYSGNGFLVKFTPSGKRIWARFVGGEETSNLSSMTLDNKENIYLTGDGNSRTNIATLGSYKDTLSHAPGITGRTDAYLIKMDSAGRKIWGTYIGGNENESGYAIELHGSRLYLAGMTLSNNNIATAGAHQTIFKGNVDSQMYNNYLMCFDTAGKRLWGTYYGGFGYCGSPMLTSNKRGDIYLYSTTTCKADIASVGAYQSTNKGYTNCYLAKFDSLGSRLWATYFGGTKRTTSGFLGGGNIACDDVGDDNNVQVFGYTNSPGLATADAYQDTLGSAGYNDAFVASFSGAGVPYYFSYYGGEDEDNGVACVYAGKTVYLAGNSLSRTGIATPGSYKPTNLSGYNASFVAKFSPVKPTSIATNQPEIPVQYSFYPNPASSHVNIKAQFAAAENGVVNIHLYNVVGKLVQSETATIHNGILDYKLNLYSSLQAGVYQLKLDYQNWTKSEKIIKE